MLHKIVSHYSELYQTILVYIKLYWIMATYIRRALQWACACQNYLQSSFLESPSKLSDPMPPGPMHRIIVLSSFRGLQDRAILIIGAGLPCNRLAQAPTGWQTFRFWRPAKSMKIYKNLWKSVEIDGNRWKSIKINENPGLGRSRHPNLVIPSPNVEFWRPPTSIFFY